MTLPPQFQFSQSSIQDYFDCQRRFELRHILRVKWPAPVSEPVVEYEHHMEQGILFHQMVQQYLANIPLEKIKSPSTDIDLQTWWSHFIHYDPIKKYPGILFPEYRLSIPLANYRLVAQYDLIIMGDDSRFAIFDWKTARVHPKKTTINHKAQSLIYPFVLVEAGFQVKKIQPEQVEMIYWYPHFPTQPDTIQYNQGLHKQNKERILSTINLILDTPKGQFELTPDSRHCLFCNYRSLCNRGDKAGNINQMGDEDITDLSLSLDIDFNNSPEIQF